MVLVLGDTT